LEKIGLRLVSEYNHDGIPCVWYELDKINYQNENNKIAGVPEHFNLPWHLAIEKAIRIPLIYNGLMFLKEQEKCVKC
jgi:hypothetical protein